MCLATDGKCAPTISAGNKPAPTKTQTTKKMETRHIVERLKDYHALMLEHQRMVRNEAATKLLDQGWEISELKRAAMETNEEMRKLRAEVETLRRQLGKDN